MPLTGTDLKSLSQARLEDARVLLSGKRVEGAAYLCGYAVELALKARIAATLGWDGYPSTKKEFEGYASFRTHDLDILLHLSGQEREVKTTLFAEWSVVSDWNPESRYQPLGALAQLDVEAMIEAATKLAGAL